jgi:hypothetical protein
MAVVVEKVEWRLDRCDMGSGKGLVEVILMRVARLLRINRLLVDSYQSRQPAIRKSN